VIAAAGGRSKPGERRRRRGLEPGLVNALLNEAGGHFSAGRLGDAADVYRRLEAGAPADIRAPYSLAVIDIRTGALQSARKRLRAVVGLDPGHFHAQHNLGAVCQSLELWSEAAGAYRRAIDINPGATETRFNLARCLTILGRIDEAVECYRALADDPAGRPRALTRMAILRPEAVDDAQFAQLKRAAADPDIDGETRIGLHFALGETLEARGEDDAAFAAFAAGNRMKLQALGRTARTPGAVAAEHAAAIGRVKSLFSPSFMAAHRDEGDPLPAPIFIVGMPRSGSSLLEQILASHPRVQGMGEVAVLSSMLDDPYAAAPGAATWPPDPRPLAQAYLAAMRGRGWKGHPRFVDKTLENYLHVGMIALMFPKATILHSVRDPVDTCLACFRQLFARGGETLYDLSQIGDEYVRYAQAMEHWKAVAPGRVIDVSLDALVASPEARIRWLVGEVCGLPWDRRCLSFHQAKRAVRTASAGQVREPIFTSSIGRWRRYEKQLGPLLEALEPLKDLGVERPPPAG